MSTLQTMEILKKKKQTNKTKTKQNKKTKTKTNKQTNKQKKQHGKIAVPFPGKFGKRKTA